MPIQSILMLSLLAEFHACCHYTSNTSDSTNVSQTQLDDSAIPQLAEAHQVENAGLPLPAQISTSLLN